jgi:hypothetical protein
MLVGHIASAQYKGTRICISELYVYTRACSHVTKIINKGKGEKMSSDQLNIFLELLYN